MNDSPTEDGVIARKSVAEAAGVDPRLLEILVCPLTKTTLRYDRERNELVSMAAISPIRSATAFRSCCRKRRAGSTNKQRRAMRLCTNCAQFFRLTGAAFRRVAAPCAICT